MYDVASPSVTVTDVSSVPVNVKFQSNCTVIKCTALRVCVKVSKCRYVVLILKQCSGIHVQFT